MRPSREFIVVALVILTLGVAAIAVSIWWRISTAATVEDQLYIAPEVTLTREMRWLQEYVRINTSNPPGNETEGAKFLARILSEHGIEAELIESAPGRGSLYARLEGADSDEALLLLHHIDVVPAEAEGWRHAPFSGDVAQGYLWGRGTLDMKGIGIAHLSAFIDLAERDVPLQRDVIFLAVADEEKGSAAGLKWLLEHRPEIFEKVTACLNEGGITEMVAGEVRYFGIETGSMVMSRWHFDAPTLRDVQKARIALEPLIQPVEPVAIEPMIEEYFSAVAPHRIVYGEQLQDIRGAIERGDYFRTGDEYRFRMEVRARVLEPERTGDGWRLPIFVFSPPAVPFRSVEEQVRNALSPVIGDAVLLGAEPPAPFSPSGTELFETIARHVRGVYGPDTAVGPYTTSTVITDSRFLRARGVHCYGFWPFPVDFFSTTTLHGPGERVRLDYFQRGVGLMQGIVGDYVD